MQKMLIDLWIKMAHKKGENNIRMDNTQNKNKITEKRKKI
jgi:hypothetical protein